MQPALFLFDDREARQWQPFALTRPIGELLCGMLPQRARAERALGLETVGYLGCDELAGFEEPGAPPVLRSLPQTDSGRVFLCSRALPAWRPAPAWPARAAAIHVGETLVGWYCPPGDPNPPLSSLQSLDAYAGPPERVRLEGVVLSHVWDLVALNSAQIAADFEALDTGRERGPAMSAVAQMIGYRPELLHLATGVTIEPHVVLDFSGGPIWLDHGVVVRAFTRLCGPAYVGPGSVLLGGPLTGVSIGPVCRVHGELEESVLLGYCNKAHDGFIGHSYLGRWVNLGALTTNSDLKNNYGSVRLWTPRGMRDTGLVKLGSLVGDHVKTGIGSLLNTGTVIGAGSSLYGSDLSSKYLAPFSWGSGNELQVYDIEKFLETAEIVMSRRDVSLPGGMRDMLRRVWSQAQPAAAAERRLASFPATGTR